MSNCSLFLEYEIISSNNSKNTMVVYIPLVLNVDINSREINAKGEVLLDHPFIELQKKKLREEYGGEVKIISANVYPALKIIRSELEGQYENSSDAF